MNTLEEIRAKLNKIPPHVLESNFAYFEKFLPVFEDIKDPCCLKYCIRPSGRYCNNCPDNPIRLASNNRVFIENARKLLYKKNYFEFIELLANSGYPHPTFIELQNLN